jgi:hypothetical protein
MADGHDDEEAVRPAYDPQNPQIISREPPLRSTAPQSDFAMAQVGFGVLVLAVGLAVTFGLALALA